MPLRAMIPTVGIGMPVFNGERFLRQAIESVLGQSLEDLELVICDNASTDRTEEICRAYAAKDSRIRYVRHAENLGAHPNYNHSFALSRGRYFKWAAHDDVLRPNFLRACVDALEQTTDAALCQSDIDYIDEHGRSIGTGSGGLQGADSPDPVTRFAALVLRPHDCQSMMGVFRRELLARSMLLPSFHGADRAMLAQVALFGRFVNVPEPLIQVRDHGERYSRSRTRPGERAAWHDTRHGASHRFPVCRTYATYWQSVAGAQIPHRQKARARLRLVEWWFRNFNAARVAVDLVGSVFPGFVGTAERIKQTIFSPAPGPGQLRRARKR